MRSAVHLTQYQFQPGQSGNRLGRAKNPVSRKEILPLKGDILKALEAALADPAQRIEALQIATVYLWGKPVEFEPSETEETNELEAAFRAVDAMSQEERYRMVRGDEPVRQAAGLTGNGTA